MPDKKCPYKEELLKRLSDEDGFQSPAREDMKHIENCTECRNAVSELQKLETDMAGYFAVVDRRMPDVGPNFSINKETSDSQTTCWWQPMFFATGFAVLLIVAGYHFNPYLKTQLPVIKSATGENVFSLLTGSVKSDEKTFEAPATIDYTKSEMIASTRSEILTPAGVQITIRPGTRFTLRKNDVFVKQGFLSIDTHGKKVTFSVCSPVVVLGIRGTAFSVGVEDSGATAVMVTEGVVSVSTILKGRFELQPGDSLGVDATGKAVLPDKTSGDKPEPEPSVGSNASASEITTESPGKVLFE